MRHVHDSMNLTETFYWKGGALLAFDEVHRFRNWSTTSSRYGCVEATEGCLFLDHSRPTALYINRPKVELKS